MIRYILVVIIVVVWMSVDIGVGSFIVLVNYVCIGNCAFLFIALMKRNMLMKKSME